MIDEVRDYLKCYDIDKVGEDSASDHVEDCNDIYHQSSKSFSIYGNEVPHIPSGIGHQYAQMYPLPMYPLPQMIDITNKKAFIVLGIFEYDSVPHDMKLLIFAENEEKARELIDETYSTDTSFFMVKNIKEA